MPATKVEKALAATEVEKALAAAGVTKEQAADIEDLDGDVEKL